MAEAPATIEALLGQARARLRAGGVAEADLDARRLAEAAFGLDRAGLILRGRDPANPAAAARLALAIDRRLASAPVGRILGRRAFAEHDFALSPDTLEPRPDTEALVDLAAERLGRLAARNGRPPVFADIGTGTGAIGVSLLSRLAAGLCVATDIALGALATARANAAAAGVAERFLPLVADYAAAFAPGLDAIVSNPPYIPSATVDTLSREVREHDPRRALDGGADGLDAYRAIAAEAGRAVRPGGLALFEIGAGQEDGVEALMAAAGFAPLERRRDLSGIVRALAFERRTGGSVGGEARPNPAAMSGEAVESAGHAGK